MLKKIFIFLFLVTIISCKKENQPAPVPESFNILRVEINGKQGTTLFPNVIGSIDCKISLSGPADTSTFRNSIVFSATSGSVFPIKITAGSNDSIIHVQMLEPLTPLSTYNLILKNGLASKKGVQLALDYVIKISTSIDTTDKFPRISDDQLLQLIQEKTFKYFYDFAEPNSGLARERNTSGDLVTVGGSGFGVMALIVGMERGFITRNQGLKRMDKILGFLETCDRFHGVWPHWLNGVTGKTIPFSPMDDGGDLVETSFMIQGLLSMRQYLNPATASENTLIIRINALADAVEYDWFTNGGQNVLYWHWSPTTGFATNVKLQGYNETLITYVLAASSTTHSIPAAAYKLGYSRNGGIRNGKTFYGYKLPLGEDYGGPLFFTHYSFLGLDPRNLQDEFANYKEQNVNQSLINYSYCVANPKGYAAYSANCWGLTASDIPGSYTASSPTNDRGVIAPTAAISSLPYTPVESMRAIRFFYYKLGDKIWSNYGFTDAFSVQQAWFASSYLAIDQGPEIVMIENFRTGLCWNLFMSCPEVNNGLTKFGFTH